MNWDLLDLELLESRKTFFFDEVHVVKPFDHLLDEEIEPLEILILVVEAENQLFEFRLVHDHNLSEGVILALAFLVGAALLLSPVRHVQEFGDAGLHVGFLVELEDFDVQEVKLIDD